MTVHVYRDFKCPYSYLASRADRLSRTGAAAVEWRPVEHDRALPVTGTPSDRDGPVGPRELAEVSLPGDQTPAAAPPLVSNTRAAVAAYAEAVTDGLADELRRRLFSAWRRDWLGQPSAPSRRSRDRMASCIPALTASATSRTMPVFPALQRAPPGRGYISRTGASDAWPGNRQVPPGERKPGMQPDIRVRRIYDDPSPGDGARVLVDRVWPRGVRKDAARLTEWAKDVAPSGELRTWYRHDPAKFGEFRRRYTAELAQPGPHDAVARLRALSARQPLTLLTATRDIGLSQAAVLADILRETPAS